MKPTGKAALLRQLESRVEQHLQTITSRIQNLDQEVLLKPAAGGGWSIAQCLEHLNSYGRYYLPEIEAGLAGAKPDATAAATFTSTWLGNYFTHMMEPGVKKYKAPKDHRPAATLDATAVVATFIEQQELLLQYLRRSEQVNLDKIRVPVSIARWIRLKLGDVFRFLIAHNERHIQQALRHLQ